MSLTGFFYTQAGLCVFVSACPPPLQSFGSQQKMKLEILHPLISLSVCMFSLFEVLSL